MGGAASRETFEQILKRLSNEDVDPGDHHFWDEMWKTTLTVEDIFQIIHPDLIRKLISERPLNLQTLFTQAVAQLYQVVETPYPVYFDQALNCARILSRILPFMLEKKSTSINELFWNKQVIPKPPPPSTTSNNDEEKTHETEPEELQETEPLAVILVNSMFHLLFLPDFTIEDPNKDFNENDLKTQEFKSALMWAPGVGSREKSVVYSTQYDRNRIDILRLMISAFSDSLFQSPDQYDSCESLWLEVGTSSEAPYAEIVFYSLINVVLGYDPVGWGLPYGNLVATDTAKSLMETAVQALIILLDYGHPIECSTLSSLENSAPSHGLALTTSPLQYVNPADVDAQGFNIFRKLLGSIDTPDQLNFMFRGFSRLLNNVHQSQTTYLPYSVTRIDIEQELMVLLWKCLEEVPKFMPYILRSCDVTELLVPICYLMLEGRKDAPRLGLLYLCTFTLLKLSGERNFGVALNKPYQLQLPVDMPLFTGNHSDLLVIVLHKLIVNGMDKLSALYNCFLTIICNISPYCKSLGAVASVKLVNLMQVFTSPRFLYAAEGNHAYVGLLLETFNNIIQYQYEGNVNLIYSVVKRKEIFERLAALTLPLAIKGAADQAKKDTHSTPTQPLPHSSSMDSGSTHDMSHADPAVTPTSLVSTLKVERMEERDIRTGPGHHHNEEKSTQHEQPSSSHPIHRFVPTEAWLQSVKAELPLNTITRLLKHLVPQIEELSTLSSTAVDENQVLNFIHRTTMVGLLPVPHPIVIRKYQPNKYTSLWFTAFMWGVIFMHNQTIPLFDGRTVRLFMVQTVS